MIDDFQRFMCNGNPCSTSLESNFLPETRKAWEMTEPNLIFEHVSNPFFT